MVTSKKANERIAGVILGEKTYRSTGTSAMSDTLAIDSRSKILSFRVQLSGTPAASSDLTMTVRNSEAGASHDCLLFSQDMRLVSSLYNNDCYYLDKGDNLHFEFANSDNFTWAITVVYGNE